MLGRQAPAQGRGDSQGFFGAGATYGRNAPPGTAEATGLSKPSLLTDETPNTQSSTRMCGRTILHDGTTAYVQVQIAASHFRGGISRHSAARTIRDICHWLESVPRHQTL